MNRPSSQSTYLKTPALLLKRLNYSESDRVVVLYTRQQGRLTALARSARDSRRRFGASLEPFVLFEAELSLPHGHAMAGLKKAGTVRVYRGLLKDLRRLGYGYRFLELMDIVEPEAYPSPLLFDRLDQALRDLEIHPHPLRVLVSFEADLLRAAGLSPVMDRCVGCGKPPHFARPAFSVSQGGLVCPACSAHAGAVVLRDLDAESLRGVFQGEEPAQGEAEAARLMETYLQYHLDQRLKSGFMMEA